MIAIPEGENFLHSRPIFSSILQELKTTSLKKPKKEAQKFW